MRFRKRTFVLNKINNFEKFFFRGKKNLSGRNNSGSLVVYSKSVRKIFNYHMYYDYNRLWSKQFSFVFSIKNINNNFFLGFVKYANGSISCIKLPHGLFLGSLLKTTMLPLKIHKNFCLGFRVNLKFLKKSSIIFDLGFSSCNKNKIARSGGTYCQIISFRYDLNLCLIKIPSKKRLYVSIDSFATLGRNSNIFKKFEWYASAGSTSILGKKPCVRGVAMNPVDHPHGGRTKTNKPEVSPWGWVTKHSH